MNAIPESPLTQDFAVQKTILVVDDERSIRELNASVLIGSGYKVVTAVDGADALAVLEVESFDLLITDQKMPKVTGVELIQKLRSEEMNLPVILASGTMPTEELNRHPGLKIDAMLTKPFTVEELLNTVKNVLSAVGNTTKSSQLFRDTAWKSSQIAQSEKPTNIISPPQSPTPRILVVDDDKDARQFSVGVLTGSGYRAEGAKDGAEGWTALQANKYDLVVTDNSMPNMTGMDMIAKLRASGMTVPVIMATGILPMNEFARTPWLKPDALLQRPFSHDALLGAVQKILGAVDGVTTLTQRDLFR
jgi:DNA-binding response OmpR family regulator